jgi:hypothetical protein
MSTMGNGYEFYTLLFYKYQAEEWSKCCYSNVLKKGSAIYSLSGLSHEHKSSPEKRIRVSIPSHGNLHLFNSSLPKGLASVHFP